MNNYAESIKETLSMAALAERIGLTVDRHGYATCPFHGEKTGSLRIYPGNRGWHCFGCHAGGSVIDFAMAYYGLTFPQAVDRLDEEFGLGLKRPVSREEREAAQRAASLARSERERRERAVRDAADMYWLMFRLYQTLDRIVTDNRPKKPEEEISPAYAAALIALPEIRDGYERAQDAWTRAKRGYDNPPSTLRRDTSFAKGGCEGKNGGEQHGTGIESRRTSGAGENHFKVGQGRLPENRRAV